MGLTAAVGAVAAALLGAERLERGLPPEDVARLVDGAVQGSGLGKGKGVLEMGGRVAELEVAAKSLASGQKLAQGKIEVLVETIAEMEPPD